MDDKKVFFVEGEDRRKFRMVIRGDLHRVSVAMIRKFLRPQGVSDDLLLYAHGERLEEHMVGSEFGLAEGDVLQLISPSAAAMSSRSGGHQSSGSPTGEGRGGDAERELELENRRLRDQVAALTSQLATARSAGGGGRSGAAVSGDSEPLDLYANAKASIRLLGEALGTPNLHLGSDLTCSIGNADTTLFITLDPPTERLYLYAALLTRLPADPAMRFKLYEVLLQGSLLSREVCGGGVGISMEDQAVLLSTSLPIAHCSPESLKEVVPMFVSTLGRWRNILAGFYS